MEVVVVFLGTYTPRLDDKGRIILPAKFRDKLAGGLVVTRGQERCLYVYALAEFQQITDSARSAPSSNRMVRDYVRLLLSGASDEIPDRQGRLSIPPPLRTYAGLERECAVIGAGNRVEIWDLTAWETYLTATEQAFADTDEEVIPGLI